MRTPRAVRVLRDAKGYLVAAAAGWPVDSLRLSWAKFICGANR